METFAANVITRRSFLFGLAGLMCLRLPPEAQAAIGLFEPFSFAYVTDVNLATRMSDTFLLLQESQLFLQDAVKTINDEKVDFVIFGGDQVEGPGKDDANWQLFLDVVQNLSMPWTFVLGEADVSANRLVDKMRTFGPDWKAKGIDTSQPYWSQSPLPGVHLVGLDTSRANTTLGEISNPQLEWLKKDLVTNARRFTIVFSHHPLLPPPPYDSGPPWDDYIVPQGPTVREILGTSKYVRLVLNGHVHISKVQQERDIWYISNPSLSTFPCGFRLFHVSPQEITVETYQVSYPALVKKGRQLLATSPMAFTYNSKKPETFVELAEGTHIDQNTLIPLALGSSPQPLRGNRKKQEEEEKESGKERKHKKHEEQAKEKKQKEDNAKDSGTAKVSRNAKDSRESKGPKGSKNSKEADKKQGKSAQNSNGKGKGKPANSQSEETDRNPQETNLKPRETDLNPNSEKTPPDNVPQGMPQDMERPSEKDQTLSPANDPAK